MNFLSFPVYVLHFKEVMILMTTDKKMKKNSSGFAKKAYRLERDFTWKNWPTFHKLYKQKKCLCGLSANKNIKAAYLLVVFCFFHCTHVRLSESPLYLMNAHFNHNFTSVTIS